MQDLRDRPAHRLLAEQGSRQPVRGSIPVFRTKYGVGLDFGHHSVKAAIVSPNKRMVLELLETDLLPERAFMEDRWDPGRHA